MRRNQYALSMILLLSGLGLAIYASRPAGPAGESSDPGRLSQEYRPSAAFPAGYELHGTLRRLSAPIAEAGKRTRIKLEYVVGDISVPAGAAIEIWEHFTTDVEELQIDDPEKPAYFSVETTAAGVEFTRRVYSNALRRNTPSVFPYRKAAGIAVTSGTLRDGDKLYFDLGGAKGVRMQAWEENLFNFRVVLVNAGDGGFLGYAGDAILTVVGGPAVKLRVQAPAIVAVGESFSVAVVPQDKHDSLARNHRGLRLRIESGDAGESEFVYNPDLLHYIARNVVAAGEGTLRLEVRDGSGELQGVSNPIWVQRDPLYRVYYGDLHQHTYIADGRGVFEELYLYARRTGLLDFGALTPHHMPLGVTGPLLFGDKKHPRNDWPALIAANKAMKGWHGFVPILAYEYSVGTAAGGHHNIYYAGDEAPSTMETDPDDPMAPIGKMLRVLRRGKKKALVIPHIGGGPPDWNHPTDPRAERLFEIASVHGVFEESWQRHLQAGVRLGAASAGDTHMTSFGNANPGNTYTMRNGLTGVYANGKNRDDIWNGLYEKRTFAVIGNQRMLLDFSVNGEQMGGELPPKLYETARVKARVSGTEPLVRIDLLKNAEVLHSVYPSRKAGKLLRLVWGDNLYVRRANYSVAKGSLTASAGVLRLERAMNLDNSFEHIEQDGNRITWGVSATSNDREAVLVDLSEAEGGTLRFHLDDPTGMGTLDVSIPLDQLRRDGHYSWLSNQKPVGANFNSKYMEMMGVEPRFTLECELVSDSHPLDYALEYEDRVAPKAGDFYYLRVEQLDTNKAWSSPVWVN